MIRPSSLPMLAQCSAFESSGGEFAELGTDRHAALKAHLTGDDSLLELLDDEDQDGVRWAADYIRANASSAYNLQVEVKRQWMRPDLSHAEGTPDVTCGPDLFDFKWRPRDYTAQLADYALERLTIGRYKAIVVHILFGATQRVEKLHLDAEACERIVLPILQRAENPAPTPCDYCGWCAKRLTCPALTKPAAVVAEGYAEPEMLAQVKDWHPSSMIEDAKQIAIALVIWRRILKKWGESVEYHALEAATKKGLKLPGFELKERRGKEFVADTQRAFELSGMPAEKFLTACAVRLNTSKAYPDRVGLDKLFAEALGLKPAAAKRQGKSKLAEVIQRGKSSLALVSAKDDEQEETE